MYKGILFSPGSGALGLEGWKSGLGGLQGVKYVEEDTIVHI